MPNDLYPQIIFAQALSLFFVTKFVVIAIISLTWISDRIIRVDHQWTSIVDSIQNQATLIIHQSQLSKHLVLRVVALAIVEAFMLIVRIQLFFIFQTECLLAHLLVEFDLIESLEQDQDSLNLGCFISNSRSSQKLLLPLNLLLLVLAHLFLY